jgi:hypothetical protein
MTNSGTPAAMLVDATGVGRPVVDMLRDRGLPVEAVIITGGNEPTSTGSEHHVPKRDLASALQVLIQTDRIKVSREMPEGEAFASELGNFGTLISPSGHDSYAARGSGHDDTVIAAVLLAWAVSRGQSADDWVNFTRRMARSTAQRTTEPALPGRTSRHY